jgi:hypothetical protein
LIVPTCSEPIIAFPATRLENTDESVFKIAAKKLVVVALEIDAFTPLIVFPAKFPVTVKFETVVDPSVDDPEVVRLEILALLVVELVTVASVIVALFANRFVALALVEEDVVALLVEA